jgi:hypothetical protein
MSQDLYRSSHLALLSIGACLLLGGPALWLGADHGTIALWGFGAACLLLVFPSFNVWLRLRDGLGNRGLNRERLTLRIIGHLLNLLALGVALTAAAALMAARGSLTLPTTLGVGVLSMALLGPLWQAKRGQAGVHPTLEFEASRSRFLLELAALLLACSLLGRWFPWADAVFGLVLALRLFVEGRALGRTSTLPAAACGSCGSCGCG